MRFFYFVLLVSLNAEAQLLNVLEFTEAIDADSEKQARVELLFKASQKSVEKFAPELGYVASEFSEKLQKRFEESEVRFHERKLIEKFGAKFKENLSEAERNSFINQLDKEKKLRFMNFTNFLGMIKTHQFESIQKNEKNLSEWKAKISLDLDKVKTEKFLKKIVLNETKQFARVYLVTEITPTHFTWTDLGLENEDSFLNPLRESWLKYLNDNIASTVDEVVNCDTSCLGFLSRFSDTSSEKLTVPEEFQHSVFLKINLHLSQEKNSSALKESSFEWEGRALLIDIESKRNLSNFTISSEKRSFRSSDQKSFNSSLASSLYRTPIPAFMQFRQKLEEKLGFTRSTSLVIRGQKNLSDVVALMELLKTRGTSLGITVLMESFSKDEANLRCYYRGEEKSFTDLLLGLKELKSTHSYTLVNEFTGLHHVLKLVTE